MTISIEDVSSKPAPYWRVVAAAKEAHTNPFTGTFDDAVDELDTLLGAAVHDCMVSNAPLGAFLLGGVDSSTIVALMQSASARPIKPSPSGFMKTISKRPATPPLSQHISGPTIANFTSPQPRFRQ